MTNGPEDNLYKVPDSSETEEPRKEQSLDLSLDAQPPPNLRPLTRDGLWAASALGFGENYLPPYVLSLGATTFEMGLLSSFPFVVSGASQLLGLRLSERGVSRRTACRVGALVQALIWPTLAAVGLLTLEQDIAVKLAVLLAAIYFALGGLMAPLWNSLIGDIIPTQLRSSYLGDRTKLVTLVTLTAFMVGGALLQTSKHYDAANWGFFAIFVLAWIGRLMSSIWLGRYIDPPYQGATPDRFTLREFVLRSEDSNFTRFVLFTSVFNLASSISSVYTPLYIIRDTGFSYLDFMFVEAAQLLIQGLSFSKWGRLIQTYGSKRILSVSAACNAFIPLLYLISGSFWPIFFIKAFSGFVWSGYVLSTSTFLFDAVSPKHRSRCAAYQGLINSILVFIGASVGAMFSNLIPSASSLDHQWLTTTSSILMVFLISAVFRLAILPFLSSFKEVRPVPHAPHLQVLFKATVLHSITSTLLPNVTHSRERTDGLNDKRGEDRELEDDPS